MPGMPKIDPVPRHIAIIMDGNGRWAVQRGKPRHVGHRAGVETVRNIIEACGEYGVGVLTLFAFSSENWKRPQKEVSLLMELFLSALEREVKRMRKRNIRLRVLGEISAFPEKLQQRIIEAERLTAENNGMLLQIAANYGGRWDITQAVRKLAARVQAGTLDPASIDESAVASALSFADTPDPDLFIRTGGEKRISNFLLWQCAYTEFHFTDTLWPDFSKHDFSEALKDYAGRQRRFGQTGEQLQRKDVEAC